VPSKFQVSSSCFSPSSPHSMLDLFLINFSLVLSSQILPHFLSICSSFNTWPFPHSLFTSSQFQVSSSFFYPSSSHSFAPRFPHLIIMFS
jgi:hypothetical protein